jgi:hypothetical protein
VNDDAALYLHTKKLQFTLQNGIANTSPWSLVASAECSVLIFDYVAATRRHFHYFTGKKRKTVMFYPDTGSLKQLCTSLQRIGSLVPFPAQRKISMFNVICAPI